jgi:MFS transporter, ACS family, hexuronate transporter
MTRAVGVPSVPPTRPASGRLASFGAPTRVRWWILAVLFIATTNNYLDRIMLTILAPVLRDDLHFGITQFGWVDAAFKFTYAAGFLLMGNLIDWKGTRLGYSLSIGIWSIAAGLHALARSFFDLGIWRGLLGLAESGNFPAGNKAVSEWFPKKDRALATSIFNSGTNIASVVGPPVFIWINANYGWRVCFLLTASTGLICLVLWWWIFRTPRQHPWINEAEIALIESDRDEALEGEPARHDPPMRWPELLKVKETYGFSLAKFFSDPVWWFYMTWLSLYFRDVRKMSLEAIGWAVPVIYIAASFGSVFGGWLSGFLMRLGWTSGKARKATMAMFALCMPIAATAVAVPSVVWAVALISLACAAHQGWSANLFTTVSDVFPKRAVGTVTGIGGFMGGMGGVIFSALLPGYVVPYFGYVPVFVTMGVLHLIAFACLHVFMGRIERVRQLVYHS